MKTIKCAIQFLVAGIIICSSAVCAQSIHKVDAEQRIKDFFTGFEKKDWNMVAGQLAEGFTFTSPNGDDHISIAHYKEKCRATDSKFFRHIEFPKMVVDGNTAFAMYNITTTDNKIVHNVEYYTFSNGKIKSIETFFGTGVHYPGNSGNVK